MTNLEEFCKPKYKQLSVYDLLETTWSMNDPIVIGEFEGHKVMTHQFMVETEPHIDPLFVAEINMNTRYIRYALPEKRRRFLKGYENDVLTVKDFYDHLKFTGVQLSEPIFGKEKENTDVEVLYNQEYFHYAKIKIFNDRMDKVIFEAERRIPLTLWSPREITTQCWYDSDENSIIKVCTDTVWLDKSGNGNHMYLTDNTN